MILKSHTQLQTKTINHKFDIDGHPVFRHEYFEYNFETNTWDRIKLIWTVNAYWESPFKKSIELYSSLNKSFPFETSEQIERDF